jgi:PPOX class probable F420-dependent enzyme
MIEKVPLISPEVRVKLDAARVARLATLDAERSPHMVPICFVCDGSVFYSAIDRKPKRVAATSLARLKNIAQTPQVALLVDHYDEDWTRLWYVLVRGEAELVSDSAERERAIQLLRSKYPQYDADMLAGDAPVLRITPARITTWGKF